MNRAQCIYALYRLFRTPQPDRLPRSHPGRVENELECSQATVKRIIAEMRESFGIFPRNPDRTATLRFNPRPPAEWKAKCGRMKERAGPLWRSGV